MSREHPKLRGCFVVEPRHAAEETREDDWSCPPTPPTAPCAGPRRLMHQGMAYPSPRKGGDATLADPIRFGPGLSEQPYPEATPNEA
jgi:hypothetical protein